MQIDVIPSLTNVSATEWNHLWAGDYPFTRHEFLLALELSGCTTARAGWQPAHCLAKSSHRLLGALPLYVKTHSYGEYIFDWSWANAYHQSGYDYYPKLLNAIPFTPATGPRLAVAADLPQEEKQLVTTALFNAALQLVDTKSMSSMHCLFPAADHAANMPPTSGFMQRLDCQYHWFNQGYSDFADFLQSFSSRKRKNVSKERARVQQQGLVVQMVEGTELSAEDWRRFYELYRNTYRKRSGHDGYLNELFFQKLGAAMPMQIVMAQARQNGEWCAAALYLKDASTLYGRYWGTVNEYDALHFECCYYQGVEYAITNKLQRFDPGTQGEHKIARGFTPVLTQSFHYLKERVFSSAIKRFLAEEKEHIRAYCADARQQVPFKVDHPLVPEDWLIAPHQRVVSSIKTGN